jgi:hypothetical protein
MRRRRVRLVQRAPDMIAAALPSDSGINTESSTESAMSEAEKSASAPEEGDPRRKNLRPPWPKGLSGNPLGRPRIEPRVRRYARRYDRRMCQVLAGIAEDEKAPWSERRRAAMDLIAVGSGRPALVQEIAGRNGAPVGPLVNVNIGAAAASGEAADVWKLHAAGLITADQAHEAYRRRQPPIEAEPAATATPAATCVGEAPQATESAATTDLAAPVFKSGAGTP